MKNNKSAGFDMISMSILLMVIGVLLSIAFQLLPNQGSIALKKTSNLLKANKNTLVGFSVFKGRVPDSTEVTTLLTSQKDGHANQYGYAYDSVVNKVGVCGASSTVISVGTVTNVAMVIWSPGIDQTSSMVSGAQSSIINYSVGSSDDMLEWVTLGDLRQRVGCDQ